MNVAHYMSMLLAYVLVCFVWQWMRLCDIEQMVCLAVILYLSFHCSSCKCRVSVVADYTCIHLILCHFAIHSCLLAVLQLLFISHHEVGTAVFLWFTNSGCYLMMLHRSKGEQDEFPCFTVFLPLLLRCSCLFIINKEAWPFFLLSVWKSSSCMHIIKEDFRFADISLV